jgi:hypothetical protein
VHRRPRQGRAGTAAALLRAPAVRFTGYSRHSVGNYQGQFLAAM